MFARNPITLGANRQSIRTMTYYMFIRMCPACAKMSQVWAEIGRFGLIWLTWPGIQEFLQIYQIASVSASALTCPAGSSMVGPMLVDACSDNVAACYTLYMVVLYCLSDYRTFVRLLSSGPWLGAMSCTGRLGC